jgi:Type I restriction enzyme R protein N terminus (HSDR_N)
MIPLNLPTFGYKLKKAEGKLWIFDVIRKKYVVLMPEEWVRQHFVNFLLNVHHYPKALIRLEGGLQYNRLMKRTDIVVFNREGSPWMVVECKAPNVPVSSETVFQASTYNNTLRAPYLAVSNGMIHFFAHIDWKAGLTQQLNNLPPFEL